VKKLLIFLIFFICAAGAHTVSNGFVGRLGDVSGFVPRPRLLKPASDIVNLGKEKELTFKWSVHEATGFGRGRRYYEFRLYKGYDMLGPALVLRKNLSGDTRSLEVSADLFESGAVYTWSLKQCYKGIGKSDRSFQSFKVIKQKGLRVGRRR